jgi:16S rRNA (adenine1518-N6/adenine1519-N6)-dimethyltransferase
VSESTGIKGLLRRYGLRPKHSLGQHFLTDARVCRAIVAHAALEPSDWVVEIGAGLGTLTAPLTEAVPTGRVVALERDAGLCAVLEAELGARPNLELWKGDALEYDLAAAAARAGKRLVVVGNLPYQITSPLLFRLVETRAAVARAVLMVQREVGERMTAAPATKAYGGITVLLGLHFEVRRLLGVGKRAFLPAPEVESCVVRLEARPKAKVAVEDEAHLARVVKAAFGQRRKTLRNALRALAAPMTVDAALAAAGVDPRRRGETLDLVEFARLAEALRGDEGP